MVLRELQAQPEALKEWHQGHVCLHAPNNNAQMHDVVCHGT
jgi:hypothetical protein